MLLNEIKSFGFKTYENWFSILLVLHGKILDIVVETASKKVFFCPKKDLLLNGLLFCLALK